MGLLGLLGLPGLPGLLGLTGLFGLSGLLGLLGLLGFAGFAGLLGFLRLLSSPPLQAESAARNLSPNSVLAIQSMQTYYKGRSGLCWDRAGVRGLIGLCLEVFDGVIVGFRPARL